MYNHCFTCSGGLIGVEFSGTLFGTGTDGEGVESIGLVTVWVVVFAMVFFCTGGCGSGG